MVAFGVPVFWGFAVSPSGASAKRRRAFALLARTVGSHQSNGIKKHPQGVFWCTRWGSSLAKLFFAFGHACAYLSALAHLVPTKRYQRFA